MNPTTGIQYDRRPTDVDCPKCFPHKGWGYRPTRKGRKRWDDQQTLSSRDVKGPCFTCAGTGLVPIPLVEVIRNCTWDLEQGKQWLEDK